MARQNSDSAALAITLASRDSLLALAQTIEAALRLEKAGFAPKISCLKTQGDLKLDAPLYQVAGATAGKEGRAFFTRELDDALLTGKADAAVHSFKDLPTEKIPGIAEPWFFSEVTGADILLTYENLSLRADTAKLVIGTSSLRRIHQLQLAFPGIRTAMLRGNIVTRLRKLREGDRGINAILIAGAGIARLKNFAAVDAATYQHFLDEGTSTHIASELEKFRNLWGAGLHQTTLEETDFPTAPGQGVLALQLGEAGEATFASRMDDIFPEHTAVKQRVMLEREVMELLQTGCHAPLGVSALPGPKKTFRISFCFSRSVTTEPVRFAESVFLQRLLSQSAAPLVHEIRTPFGKAVWWGLGLPPKSGPTLQILPVRAIRQVDLEPPAPPAQDFAAAFVSSPAVFRWLRENPGFTALKLVAAGRESEQKLRQEFPKAHIIASGGRGFPAVIRTLQEGGLTKLLWLGSRAGEARARRIAGDIPGIQFLPVYDNVPLTPAELSNENPGLGTTVFSADTIQLITSASAATAFVSYCTSLEIHNPVVSCFGESAADLLFEHDFTPYHVSDAETFAEYLNEITGNPEGMRK